MEQVYALGVTLIEFIQYWFQDWEEFFERVNDLSNPYFLLEVLFPLVSIVDSVFASQLLLCLGFGGWLNGVMKWWLLEDRPYWWVQETSFYPPSGRPRLHQTRQSCEPGPGSPSGHSAAGAAVLLLLNMWLAHVMQDRKCYVRWWKYVMYPLCAGALASIMLARMYVAAHFPHQCLLGGLIGAFMAPALCIYVTDPFIWRYGTHATMPCSTAVRWHAISALIAAAISALTYWSMKICGLDPQSTIKLAFRWCEKPENIHVSATPIFTLATTAAVLLSWALFVTPAVAEYRHYTRNRSLVLSTFATGLFVYGINHITANIDKTNTFVYYVSHFIIAGLKPPLFLRVAPALAMWPYGKVKAD